MFYLGRFQQRTILNSKLIPTSKELKEFERDPHIALLALVVNSGQGRYLETDDNLTQESIENIKEKISNNLKAEDIGKIFSNFKKNFDKEARLYGCGTCGIRGFEMGNSNFKYK